MNNRELLNNQILSGIISADEYFDQFDSKLFESKEDKLFDKAEDNLENVLKMVVDKLPKELKNIADQKGDKDGELDLEEYQEIDQVAGRGGAFARFTTSENYDLNDENELLEAIKDFSGNYMLNLNEADFKGVGKYINKDNYKKIYKAAPKRYLNELNGYFNELNGVLKDKKEQDKIKVKDDSLDEGLGAIAASAAISAPVIAKNAGQLSKWMGKKFDSKVLGRVGDILEKFGQEWHNTYQKVIENMIRKLAPNMEEEKLKKVSRAVLLSIMGAIALTSSNGATVLMSKGKAAASFAETVSTVDVLKPLAEFNPEKLAKGIIRVLPTILNQYFEGADPVSAKTSRIN